MVDGLQRFADLEVAHSSGAPRSPAARSASPSTPSLHALFGHGSSTSPTGAEAEYEGRMVHFPAFRALKNGLVEPCARHDRLARRRRDSSGKGNRPLLTAVSRIGSGLLRAIERPLRSHQHSDSRIHQKKRSSPQRVIARAAVTWLRRMRRQPDPISEDGLQGLRVRHAVHPSRSARPGLAAAPPSSTLGSAPMPGRAELLLAGWSS
jgi:hypothetical protein